MILESSCPALAVEHSLALPQFSRYLRFPISDQKNRTNGLVVVYNRLVVVEIASNDSHYLHRRNERISSANFC